MQQKILSKRGLLIVFPSGAVLFAAVFLNFTPSNTPQGSSAMLSKKVVATSPQEEVSVGMPVRLKIPAIGVDASVLALGLTSDGAMDVPKNPDDVAWYSLGARPGQVGSAVIAGHYDWIKNIPAVFIHLNKLTPGDKILVEDENGVISTFVVREVRTFDNDEDASKVFVSDDNKAHLNLITCTGDWNKAEKTYNERLIVFTDKE